MRPKTILVVEDDAPTREGYAALLRDCGYRVIEAQHGGEAIMRAQRHEVDAVLLDLVMPGLGGVEAAEWLRGFHRTARTPILAVTGCASEVDRERMRMLCDDLLVKPCPAGVILQRVTEITRSRATSLAGSGG